MADVYARTSGEAGVCVVGSGAASTNLVTGLASATKDHAPVVAITGQRSLSRSNREPYQGIGIVATVDKRILAGRAGSRVLGNHIRPLVGQLPQGVIGQFATGWATGR